MIEEQILGRVAEGALITHLDLGKPGRSRADSGEGGWAEFSVPAVLLGELEHPTLLSLPRPKICMAGWGGTNPQMGRALSYSPHSPSSGTGGETEASRQFEEWP